MNISKLKSIAVLAMSLLCSLFFTSACFAEDNASTIEVSPMIEQMILRPGETYHSSVDVRNPYMSKTDLSYSVEVGSYSVVVDEDGNYGGTDTASVSSYNQIMNWIVLDETSGTLAPNEKDTITFTIKVPENAPAGGQYASIIFNNTTDDGARAEGNIAIKSKVSIAHVILAEVAGESRETGEIIENNIPGFRLDGSLEATSIVKNSGNVHARAQYILQVWPLFSDEELCTNEEEPGDSLILPETEKYHAETCQLPPVGIFRAKQTVKIFGETSIVEKTVIVCPIWLLFIIIFAIFALVFYFVAKARKKTAQRAEKSA